MTKKSKRVPAVKSKEDLANEVAVEKLLPEINANHRECIKSGSDAIQYAIQAGALLLKLKESVKHGEWLPLLEKRVDCTPRAAQNYMKIVGFKETLEEQGKDVASDATIGGCLKMIGQSKHPPKPPKSNTHAVRISPTPGNGKNKNHKPPEPPPPPAASVVEESLLEAEPEQELDFDGQVKAANKKIESFCRALVTFYEENCPKLESINYQGRYDSAMAHVKACCGTLRTCKYHDKPCPKCGGDGCSSCSKESDFGGVTAITFRALAG